MPALEKCTEYAKARSFLPLLFCCFAGQGHVILGFPVNHVPPMLSTAHSAPFRQQSKVWWGLIKWEYKNIQTQVSVKVSNTVKKTWMRVNKVEHVYNVLTHVYMLLSNNKQPIHQQTIGRLSISHGTIYLGKSNGFIIPCVAACWKMLMSVRPKSFLPRLAVMENDPDTITGQNVLYHTTTWVFPKIGKHPKMDGL